MKTILETHKLSKHFDSLVAIDALDFTLKESERRALIGPNGAGKTTFINLICGVLKPSSGKIFFQGEDLTNLAPHEVARLGIARTFQIVSLFPQLTAYESLLAAVQRGGSWLRRSARLERCVQELIELIHLQEKARYKACELSHGEQKRLEIGITLGTQPKLLLLDEPTAGLDTAESRRIIELIKSLKDMSILVVEHDINVVVELADSITVLHRGRIIAEGTPEQIAKNKDVQEVYLQGRNARA